MNKIGKWTEEVNIVKNNLKNFAAITKDGEIVELHNSCLEELAMTTVGIAEELNEIDNPKKGNSEGFRISKGIKEFNNSLKNECGEFYFSFYNRYKDIPLQYLFRVVYLSTYLHYDGYLEDSGGELINEKDLFNLLNLGKSEYYNTKNYLEKEGFIIFDKLKNVMINDKYFKKGSINKRKNIEVSRMFEDVIREIYNNSKPKDHKKLGLLIKLLPYMHYKYNILCKNPSEEREVNVQPISLNDLAEILGYGQTNISRLKKDLFSIMISKNECVISIVENKFGKKIVINPRFTYKGGNEEEFKYTRSWFTGCV